MANIEKRLDDLEAVIKPADPEQLEPIYHWRGEDGASVESHERPPWFDDFVWIEIPALSGDGPRYICACRKDELEPRPERQPGQVLRGYSDGSYSIDDGPRFFPDENE